MATAIAGLAWLAFFGIFYLSHRDVRAARAAPAAEETRLRREPSSDAGMALQFAAALAALFAPGPARLGWLAPALILFGLSMGFGRAALQHLGRQWRVQAVVTDDHELITTGPYRVVRHPVYLAFFGMVAATALLRGTGLGGALALLLFAAGTEIRVRAEERILAETFQERFVVFLTATPWAWLPRIR